MVPSSVESGLNHPSIVICFSEGEASFDDGNIWMNDWWFKAFVNMGLPSNPTEIILTTINRFQQYSF